MAFGFGSLFRAKAVTAPQDVRHEYAQMKDQTGLSIVYERYSNGSVVVSALSDDVPPIEVSFPDTATDEAHILYTLSGELLRSRAAAGQDHATIRNTVEGLFSSYRR